MIAAAVPPMPQRWWIASVLPPLLMLGWAVFPLARGSDTLYLRDVFATHLPLKQAQAEGLRRGHLDSLDPYRGLGQPLLGNLNAVPLYPDNLLYLAGSTLWALNAHFWLHWLLAAPAMYALGRSWGLSPPASWAAGLLWATSGYFGSQLNFYNLVAGVALAPAFVAACLAAGRKDRPPSWHAGAAGLLWALLLLAGDPMTAFAALAAGAAALLAGRHGAPAEGPVGVPAPAGTGGGAEASGRLPRLAMALACGTLAAAPQLVELARAVAGSFRGLQGYSLRAATAASWDPRQALDWLLPFPFGRVDLLGPGSFWGHAFHGGNPPFLLSLYPGLLALALVAASGRPRAAAERWAWALAAAGVFFALGRHNPLAAWVFPATGLRYPAKLWLLPAMGLALLAGVAFERAFVLGQARARRRIALALSGLALLFALAVGVSTLAPGAALGFLRGLIPATRPDAFVEAERLRLATLCLASAGIAAALAIAAWAAGRRPWAWGAGLLGLHTATQLVLLAPLAATDAALPYRVPPPLAARLAPQALAAHGGFAGLFGRGGLETGSFPEPRARWLARRAFFELYPASGPILGRRYAFNPSPEGLDSFQARMAQAAVAGSADGQRLSLLAASGVDVLLLDRPLSPEAAGAASLLAEMPSFGRRVFAYAVAGGLGEARLAGRVRRAADLDRAYQRLTHPAFDPRREAVVTGTGPALDGPAGEVRTLMQGADGWAGEVASPLGGVLVLRRAYLPLYRALLDGRPTRAVVANLHLLGVEVPPGSHRVEVSVDRRPLLASLAPAALGGIGLLLLARRKGPARG